MRALLNSGGPLGADGREHVRRFLGAATPVAFVTAANLHDEGGYFDALGLVGFNINPPYKEADPMMAPGSETRDDRIREYHAVNDNPVLGLEEGALVRCEDGAVTALGVARVRLFRRGLESVWYSPGSALPVQ